MARQLLPSKRAPVRVARWKIEVSAVAAAMGIAVAVASLIAGNGDTATAYPTRGATSAFSKLSKVPSHNSVYRASLVPSSDAAGSFDSRVWTVTVQTATGTPVDDATLALESWMPDDDSVPARHPRMTQYLGGGRYRIEGLRFDRHGWWNVRLQVSAPGGTDSLAFNLVR